MAGREVDAGDAAVPRLELPEWAERYGVVAGITARPMSLGLWSDESVGQVMGRWRAFRAAFAPRFSTTVLSHQVHGSEVRWHAGRPEGWLILDGVDGHATAEPGVLLTITVADCVPVYLVAPDKGALALLHAGWRGTAARVLERGVQLLKQRAFARAGDIVMHCGVGICGVCYEVGSEVDQALRGSVRELPAGARGGYADLRAVLAQQARELGLGAVTVSPWCSAHDRDRFFSHRASGGRDGRMVAYLGRPTP
ncbi:MAG TPA: polyphenol oxidase family protein [Gemmatimonadales bacterium]|nr:polyphenol oxidase family protein [Gemmatimonadales bacterium]